MIPLGVSRRHGSSIRQTIRRSTEVDSREVSATRLLCFRSATTCVGAVTRVIDSHLVKMKGPEGPVGLHVRPETTDQGVHAIIRACQLERRVELIQAWSSAAVVVSAAVFHSVVRALRSAAGAGRRNVSAAVSAPVPNNSAAGSAPIALLSVASAGRKNVGATGGAPMRVTNTTSTAASVLSRPGVSSKSIDDERKHI